MCFDENRINLSRISSDERFRISTRTDSDDLCDSVRHIGLINPPILLSSDTDFVIISGFRRIEACGKIGMTDIPARIVNLTDIEALKLAISDNAFQRALNLIEISRSLYKLSAFINNDDELSPIAASLKLPSTRSLICKLKTLCQMPQAIQEGILSEAVALPTAIELQKLDPYDMLVIAELFRQLIPSLNKQRELLTLLQEISIREDIPIRSLLDDLKDIIADSESDRNQKLKKIRLYLKQRRFPASSQAEAQFDEWVKRLELGNGIELIPPKYFEGNTYTFSMQFTSLDELCRRKARLDKIIENPFLRHYFSANNGTKPN
jgi:ParB family chromosome partitioning protein